MKQSAFISALKFVAHAKAVKDVRYYLNTVKLEFKADVLTLVATDGHRMAWAEVEAEGMPDAEYLLSGADIDVVLKVLKANSTGVVALIGHDRRVEFQAGGQGISCAEVDGKFPDWRRLLTPADGLSVDHKDINCDYLAAAGKAFSPLLGKYGRTTMHIGTAGSCLRLECKPEVKGVLSAQCIIMPMRA